MMANCCRFCGLESTLAPTSIRMVAVPCAVGKTAASAGRSTPGIAPKTILAVAMAAPVLPAVTKPAALPSRTMRSPTCMEESRLVRTACAAFSCMPMTSRGVDYADGKPAPEAVQIEFGPDDFFSADQHHFHVVVACGENGAFHFGFRRAVGAHGVKSDDGRHVCLSACKPDRTWSSSCQRSETGRKSARCQRGVRGEPQGSKPKLAGGLFDLDDFAALIVAALGAGTMRQFALVAIGTLRQRLAPSDDRGRGAWRCAPSNDAVSD